MAIIGRNGSSAAFQQRGQFARRVKVNFGGVRVFGAHGVGFKQAMRDGQIIFADRPLQKLPDGGAVVVAAFGGSALRDCETWFQLPSEPMKVSKCSLLKSQTAVSGKRVGESAQLNLPVVGIFGGQLRPLAVAGLCARRSTARNSSTASADVFALHAGDGAQDNPSTASPNVRPFNLADASTNSETARQQGHAPACGAVEVRETFQRGQRVAGLRGVQGGDLRAFGQILHQRRQRGVWRASRTGKTPCAAARPLATPRGKNRVLCTCRKSWRGRGHGV